MRGVHERVLTGSCLMITTVREPTCAALKRARDTGLSHVGVGTRLSATADRVTPSGRRSLIRRVEILPLKRHG